MQNKERQIVVVTHDDLDGVMSGVVMKHVIEKMSSTYPKYKGASVVVRFVAVSAANEVIRDISELGIQVVATDLSIDETTFKAMLDVVPVIPELPVLIDHHRDSEKFAAHERAVVSSELSATMLALGVFSDRVRFPEYPKKCFQSVSSLFFPKWIDYFAMLADDYDRWIHKYPESRLLNALVAILSPEGAFQKMDTERERLDIENNSLVSGWIQRQKNRIFKGLETVKYIETEIEGEKKKLALIPKQEPFSAGDVNEICHLLMTEHGCSCAAYSYGEKNSIRMSIRSVDGLAGKMVEHLRKIPGVQGGGHDNACGLNFSISGKTAMTIDDVFAYVGQAFSDVVGGKAPSKRGPKKRSETSAEQQPETSGEGKTIQEGNEPDSPEMTR